jgi:hypothetical protein
MKNKECFYSSLLLLAEAYERDVCNRLLLLVITCSASHISLNFNGNKSCLMPFALTSSRSVCGGFLLASFTVWALFMCKKKKGSETD